MSVINLYNLGLYILIALFFCFSYTTNFCEPAIDDLVSLGSQFSKSPDERENMLKARKQAMIMKARQRYMTNKEGDSSLKTD